MADRVEDITGQNRTVAEMLIQLDDLQNMGEPSHSDGGKGGSGDRGMNFGERIARLEGGQTALFGSVAIVSALLLGAMGLLLSMMLDMQSQFGDLGSRVDALGNRVGALPGEINQNLMELNRTLADSITAARSGQQPQVIIIDRSEPTSGE